MRLVRWAARRRFRPDERAELVRLRRAEREWHLEREVLRKAAQYFAREMK